LLKHQQSIIKLCLARNYSQQRRFAGTVTSDQAYALACLKRELSMIKERNMAEG
jgi:hypothetical protein